MNKQLGHFITILLFICLLMPKGVVYAQGKPPTVFEGRVTFDHSGEPAICYVLVNQGNGNVSIGYTSTNANGYYTVRFSSEADSVTIALSGMNIKPIRCVLPNTSGQYDFEVGEKAFEVKELTIRAPKIERKGEDTLSYNVESFRSKEDLAIVDVLKKMPGITVRETGEILYKMKPISGLTIDGMDLLKGRYNIATKNVSPNHIATVEILENHQVIQALKDLVPSDKNYINLKLKSSSKGVFILSAALGGGYGQGGLWSVEMAPMFFNHSIQHIATAKTNNAGNDLRGELNNLTYNSSVLNPVLSNATLASPPNISKEKYYRNTSYAATISNLLRTRKKTDITLHLAYLNDTELRDNAATTRWMLPDSSMNVIQETISNVMGTHLLNAELSFLNNASNRYISVENSFEGEFAHTTSVVNQMHQDFDKTTLKARSNFYLVNRSNEQNAIQMDGNIIYEHTPYSLIIAQSEGLYGGARQQVASNALAALFHVESVRSFIIGKVSISPNMVVNYRLSHLNSRLSLPEDLSVMTPDAQNKMQLHRLLVAPQFSARYTSAHLDASLMLPVTYHLTFHENQLTSTQTWRHKVFVEPELNATIKITSATQIKMDYSLSWSEPAVSSLFEGAILSDYRSLTRYVTDFTEGMSSSITATLSRKNLFKMSFINFSAGYILIKPNILYGYDFNGIYSSTLTARTNELSHVATVGAEWSKGFYWKDLTARVEVGATWTQSPFLMQEQVSRVHRQAYSGQVNINFSPFSFLGITYTGKAMYSLSKQAKGESLSPLTTASNDLLCTFRLPLSIGATLSGEHYYNSASNPSPSFLLLNAGVTYTWKKLRWQLTCANLLNTQRYVYSTLSSTGDFSTNYLIRPRSFILTMHISF